MVEQYSIPQLRFSMRAINKHKKMPTRWLNGIKKSLIRFVRRLKRLKELKKLRNEKL